LRATLRTPMQNKLQPDGPWHMEQRTSAERSVL